MRTSTLDVVKPAIKIIAITMKRRRSEKRSLVINWILVNSNELTLPVLVLETFFAYFKFVGETLFKN